MPPVLRYSTGGVHDKGKVLAELIEQPPIVYEAGFNRFDAERLHPPRPRQAMDRTYAQPKDNAPPSGHRTYFVMNKLVKTVGKAIGVDETLHGIL